MNGETVEGLIKKAHNSLKESDAGRALLLLHDALKLDYEHPEVLYGMKAIDWWLDRLSRLERFRSPYERGGFILSQWKSFRSFQQKFASGAEGAAGSYAIKRWIFSEALAFFREVLGEGGMDPEVLFHIGRCYKGVGDYDEALRHLEQAAGLKNDDAGIVAELADVNALLEDGRTSKVQFREAFFLDAQNIELGFLESEMIVMLIRKTEELGFEGAELAEWIPVYGTIWGVFSVKKELRAMEAAKLKQSILDIEGEIQSGKEMGLLKPRLLNRYFRLADYYKGARRVAASAAGKPTGRGTAARSTARKVSEEDDAVEEIMMKIKFLDEAIYEQYRK